VCVRCQRHTSHQKWTTQSRCSQTLQRKPRAWFGNRNKHTPNKCADCDKLTGRYYWDHSKFSFITLLKLAEHMTAQKCFVIYRSMQMQFLDQAHFKLSMLNHTTFSNCVLKNSFCWSNVIFFFFFFWGEILPSWKLDWYWRQHWSRYAKNKADLSFAPHL